MTFSRRTLLVTSASAGGLTLFGCASPMPARPTLSELGIYSAGQGSAFLPYAQGVAQFLSGQGLKTQALISAGSIENIRKIDVEKQQLATVFLGTAHEAITGTGAWTQGQKFPNLRALFPMYETSFQIATLRRAGIDALAGLRGKRVGVGPAGGPAESFFKGVMEVTGINAQIINGTPAALAADLLAGQIDALWQGAALPISALKQVADSAEANVFGLGDEVQAAMLKRFAFLSPAQISANTYRGQTQAVKSVAAWNFAMAHAEFPEIDAYWITRQVLSLDNPSQIHASAAPTRMQNAPLNRVVSFHAGALRFYKEKGVL
jgi:uncharacterized protein